MKLPLRSKTFLLWGVLGLMVAHAESFHPLMEKYLTQIPNGIGRPRVLFTDAVFKQMQEDMLHNLELKKGFERLKGKVDAYPEDISEEAWSKVFYTRDKFGPTALRCAFVWKLVGGEQYRDKGIKLVAAVRALLGVERLGGGLDAQFVAFQQAERAAQHAHLALEDFQDVFQEPPDVALANDSGGDLLQNLDFRSGFHNAETRLKQCAALESQAVEGERRRDAAFRRPLQVALHDEKRLVGLFDGIGLLADRDGDGGQPHRAAAELDADRLEDAAATSLSTSSGSATTFS